MFIYVKRTILNQWEKNYHMEKVESQVTKAQNSKKFQIDNNKDKCTNIKTIKVEGNIQISFITEMKKVWLDYKVLHRGKKGGNGRKEEATSKQVKVKRQMRNKGKQ